MKTVSAEISMLQGSLELALQAWLTGDAASAGALMDSVSVHAKLASDAMYALVPRAEPREQVTCDVLGLPDFRPCMWDCVLDRVRDRHNAAHPKPEQPLYPEWSLPAVDLD
jgi:hypothetical protein